MVSGLVFQQVANDGHRGIQSTNREVQPSSRQPAAGQGRCGPSSAAGCRCLRPHLGKTLCIPPLREAVIVPCGKTATPLRNGSDIMDSTSGASGAGGSNAANNANSTANDAQAAENAANVETAVDAAKTAAQAALDAQRACDDPAAAQAAADRAKEAAETATAAANAVANSNNGLGPMDGSHEISDNAALDAAASARDAQAAADRAKESRCEGVPTSQAQPPSPTQGLALGTINQLGAIWS